MDDERAQEPIEPAAPAGSDEVAAGDADDVEGHSLLTAEFGRRVADDRARDAAGWARGEAARRQAKKDPKDRRR